MHASIPRIERSVKVGVGVMRPLDVIGDRNVEVRPSRSPKSGLARTLAQYFSDRKAEFHALGSLGDDVATFRVPCSNSEQAPGNFREFHTRISRTILVRLLTRVID
jgi:hypothetical protein